MVTDECTALEQAIDEDPTAIDLRLIYADWLEDHGRAEEAKESRRLAEMIRLNIDELTMHAIESARNKGRSESFIKWWLEIWKQHCGYDPGWDSMWKERLELGYK